AAAAGAPAGGPSRPPVPARPDSRNPAPARTPAPRPAPPTPTHPPRQTRRPRARASSAAHTGWVATSAVDEATEDSTTDGTQVPKCAASSDPASSDSHHCRRSSRRSSARRRSPAHGSSTPAAIAVRQNAMASAGAALAAMIGPAVDTAASATASRPRSRGGGSLITSTPGAAALLVRSVTRPWCPADDADPVGGLILSVGCGTLTGMNHPESVPQAATSPADQGVEVPPLVVEATRKAGLVWIAVPGQPRATGAWFVWTDGGRGTAAYVVTGPGEQPLPGLAGAAECAVSVPSADKHGRIVTWTAAVHRVEPGGAEWDAVVPGMLTKRLNLPDADGA